MPERPPAAARLPRHTPLSELVDLVAVEEEGFVTADGRLGRALACTGLNPRIQSDAGAELTAALFGQALSFLPPEAHLQLVVLNRPLRGEAWVPAHLAQYRPPPGPLADVYLPALEAAYTRELAGRHVADLRFYAVLT
ncbi:MAG: hypothetical protein M3Q65_00620, partial [Chloroflexota bacterium]|nr:hypothetical protein [Chloroflexota bacterium]